MKKVSARTRTAFHEAGHAVLSAAVANPPEDVTIKADGHLLGRNVARMSARPSARFQVHLAGFAAEHLLTGRRPRQLDQEIGFSLLARLDPGLGEAYAGSESRDGHRAVEEVLRVATYEDDDAIRLEINRFYEVARESLSVVWPSVKAVAKALCCARSIWIARVSRTRCATWTSPVLYSAFSERAGSSLSDSFTAWRR